MKTYQEFISEAKKCWPGYKKKGTQKLFGKSYNRCVKEDIVSFAKRQEKKGKGTGPKPTKTPKELIDLAKKLENKKEYELEESSTGEKSGRRTRGKVTLARGSGDRSSGMSTRDRLLRHRLQRGMKKGQDGREAAERQYEEQYDLYDLILSHLLDEGYASTPEAAEAMMVNMSEEWRESIVEGMKPYPTEKVARKREQVKRKEDIATYQRKDDDANTLYKRGVALALKKKMSEIGR